MKKTLFSIALPLVFFGVLGLLALTKASSQEKMGTLNLRSFERTMVLIRAGSFEMGAENHSADERPVRVVRIKKAFYMGKYEVTQAQWKAVMEDNPSQYKGDKLPVNNVS